MQNKFAYLVFYTYLCINKNKHIMIPIYQITSNNGYETEKNYFCGESALLYFRGMLEDAIDNDAHIVASNNCTFSGIEMIDSMEMLELCQKNAMIWFTMIDNETEIELIESIVERIEVK